MSAEALWPIPADWCWTQITQLGDVVSGGTPSSKEPKYWGGDINWISPADLTGYKEKFISKGAKSITQDGLINSSAKLMPAGSIHFSSRAPIGYVAISSSPMTTNQGFKSLIPFTGVFNEYVYYYLKASKQLAEKRASGTTFLELSGKAFGLLPVPLPPPNEQKRIVAKIEELFSELDNGIAALKTAREQLKVYRQAVLKHAFEGKLTAQWRAENQDKLETPEQLLTRIQQEREARYQQQLEDWKTAVKEWEANGKKSKKPSKPTKLLFPRVVTSDDLPLLPSGWAWIEYAGICEKIRNGVSAKPIGETGNKILRISAVRAMQFDLNDTRYLQDIDGQYSDYFLSKGDLVFTRYNGTRDYVGVCAEYRGDGTHLYPDKLIQTRTAVSSISPSYLEKAINSGGSRKFIEKRIRTTAGQSGISGGDIKSMPVPICCKEEQKIIERHLESELSNVTAISDEIESGLKKAETLRQSILKKAFSGQLVPQDPNDEPASELLARIQAEKAAANARKKAAAKSKVSAKPAARRGNLSRVTP
jgi:Restriction endonuclease S subunits